MYFAYVIGRDVDLLRYKWAVENLIILGRYTALNGIRTYFVPVEYINYLYRNNIEEKYLIKAYDNWGVCFKRRIRLIFRVMRRFRKF